MASPNANSQQGQPEEAGLEHMTVFLGKIPQNCTLNSDFLKKEVLGRNCFLFPSKSTDSEVLHFKGGEH